MIRFHHFWNSLFSKHSPKQTLCRHGHPEQCLFLKQGHSLRGGLSKRHCSINLLFVTPFHSNRTSTWIYKALNELEYANPLACPDYLARHLSHRLGKTVRLPNLSASELEVEPLRPAVLCLPAAARHLLKIRPWRFCTCYWIRPENSMSEFYYVMTGQKLRLGFFWCWDKPSRKIRRCPHHALSMIFIAYRS